MSRHQPFGVHQAIKTVLVDALTAVFTEFYPQSDAVMQRVVGNIELEYPQETEKYPGIWLQTTLSDIRWLSTHPHFYEWDNVQIPYMEGMFTGSASMNVFATSAIERDKISDALINFLLFGRINPEANKFWETLANASYIRITVANDRVRSGGQSVQMGVPWQRDLLVYSDSYTFQFIGQFASRFDTGELVPLERIHVIPILVDPDGNEAEGMNDGNGFWV